MESSSSGETSESGGDESAPQRDDEEKEPLAKKARTGAYELQQERPDITLEDAIAVIQSHGGDALSHAQGETLQALALDAYPLNSDGKFDEVRDLLANHVLPRLKERSLALFGATCTRVHRLVEELGPPLLNPQAPRWADQDSLIRHTVKTNNHGYLKRLLAHRAAACFEYTSELEEDAACLLAIGDKSEAKMFATASLSLQNITYWRGVILTAIRTNSTECLDQIARLMPEQPVVYLALSKFSSGFENDVLLQLRRALVAQNGEPGAEARGTSPKTTAIAVCIGPRMGGAIWLNGKQTLDTLTEFCKARLAHQDPGSFAILLSAFTSGLMAARGSQMELADLCELMKCAIDSNSVEILDVLTKQPRAAEACCSLTGTGDAPFLRVMDNSAIGPGSKAAARVVELAMSSGRPSRRLLQRAFATSVNQALPLCVSAVLRCAQIEVPKSVFRGLIAGGTRKVDGNASDTVLRGWLSGDLARRAGVAAQLTSQVLQRPVWSVTKRVMRGMVESINSGLANARAMPGFQIGYHDAASAATAYRECASAVAVVCGMAKAMVAMKTQVACMFADDAVDDDEEKTKLCDDLFGVLKTVLTVELAAGIDYRRTCGSVGSPAFIIIEALASAYPEALTNDNLAPAVALSVRSVSDYFSIRTDAAPSCFNSLLISGDNLAIAALFQRFEWRFSGADAVEASVLLPPPSQKAEMPGGVEEFCRLLSVPCPNISMKESAVNVWQNLRKEMQAARAMRLYRGFKIRQYVASHVADVMETFSDHKVLRCLGALRIQMIMGGEEGGEDTVTPERLCAMAEKRFAQSFGPREYLWSEFKGDPVAALSAYLEAEKTGQVRGAGMCYAGHGCTCTPVEHLVSYVAGIPEGLVPGWGDEQKLMTEFARLAQFSAPSVALSHLPCGGVSVLEKFLCIPRDNAPAIAALLTGFAQGYPAPVTWRLLSRAAEDLLVA